MHHMETVVAGERVPVPERFSRLRGYYVSKAGKLYDTVGRTVPWAVSLEGLYGIACRVRKKGQGLRWEWYSAARIVHEAFRGRVPNRYLVAALNGKQGDLRLANLMAMTQEEADRIGENVKPAVEREERWRPVPLPGADLYEVSDHGRVRNKHTKREIQRVSRGSVVVNMSIWGKRNSKGVRALVAAAFLGPCPEGHYATAIDGDARNVALSNTQYVKGSKPGAAAKPIEAPPLPAAQQVAGEPQETEELCGDEEEDDAPINSCNSVEADPGDPDAHPHKVDFRRGHPRRIGNMLNGSEVLDQDVCERWGSGPHPKRDKAYKWVHHKDRPRMPDELLSGCHLRIAYLRGPNKESDFHELFIAGMHCLVEDDCGSVNTYALRDLVRDEMLAGHDPVVVTKEWVDAHPAPLTRKL